MWGIFDPTNLKGFYFHWFFQYLNWRIHKLLIFLILKFLIILNFEYFIWWIMKLPKCFVNFFFIFDFLPENLNNCCYYSSLFCFSFWAKHKIHSFYSWNLSVAWALFYIEYYVRSELRTSLKLCCKSFIGDLQGIFAIVFHEQEFQNWFLLPQTNRWNNFEQLCQTCANKIWWVQICCGEFWMVQIDG